MEALSSSIVRTPTPAPSRRSRASSAIASSSLRAGRSKAERSPDLVRLSCREPRAQRSPCRVGSLSRDTFGGGEEDADVALGSNGVGLIPDVGAPCFEVFRESELNHGGSPENEVAEASEALKSVPLGNATNVSRAGLFRTPISGGVLNATSTHDLPRPALAVRNLMEQARFAHLSTVMSRMHHRRAAYPFGSLVDFVADPMGHPIFSLSPLAIHTRNLLADSRCTLVVQTPGWTGLSNARVTLFGDAVPLSDIHQEWARKQYIAKHQQWASQQWGNFHYFRMQNISDIYFIGGFGTVAWLNVKEYEALQPDKIAIDGGEQSLKELNAMFSKSLREIISTEAEIDDAAFISIDSKGTDIRVRQGAQFNIQRLSFEVAHEVETLEEAKNALERIIKKGLRSR